MISTGRYASNHGGLVIYLNKKKEYKLKTDVTKSKLWERQIIDIFDPNKTKKKINLLLVISTGHHIIHVIVLILL